MERGADVGKQIDEGKEAETHDGWGSYRELE